MSCFSIKKRFTFEAAHYLPHHDGKCQRLHGHSWVGWVEVRGSKLQSSGPQTGMLLDFGDISTAVKPLVDDYLDHYCLNETLNIESPTSEEIARWVFDRLECRGLPVAAVTIRETCTSECTYRG